MAQTTVIGLNCSGHDAAAALAVDGVVIAATSEERLTRVKHQGGFPKRALDYCLREAGLDRHSAKVEAVVINQAPFRHFDNAVRNYFARDAIKSIVVNPSHHYLHACYAQIFTPIRPIVILVVDGNGGPYAEHNRRGGPLLGRAPSNEDMLESLTAYYVDAQEIESLLIKDWGAYLKSGFPSLGHMYADAAAHIFGSRTAAGKVMGLAPFGDPTGIGNKPIVTLTSEGIEVAADWLAGIPKVDFDEHFERVPIARDIAAKVQAELENALMHLCKVLRGKTGCESMCLTGGVALNSVFNGRLAKERIFKHIVVCPASHDAGTAIGAAAFGYKKIAGTPLRFRADPEFLGHRYRDKEIMKACAQSTGVLVTRPDDSITCAARELADGKTVGWFESEAEFGPRALGHRSILADPRRTDMKVKLNSRVKFRESFRPFAAAVLEEHCEEWFDQSVTSPHMLMVAGVLPAKRELIPAVVHVDNTCRLQTVSRTFSGSLRALIEAFCSLTGVPLLLNTSLNILGQPISETPQDAIDCLVMSGLDVLYCGPYRLQKEDLPASISDHLLQPVPTYGYSLISRYVSKGSETRMAECYVIQGVRKIRITVAEREILTRIEGSRSLAELVQRLPSAKPAAVTEIVKSLCERGILYLTPCKFDDKSAKPG
jgi:carbamoyltransferase